MNYLYFLLESSFKDAMKDARTKGNKVTEEESKKAVDELKANLQADLNKFGEVKSIDMNLGKFRGSFYVTTCKISIKLNNLNYESKLLELLISKYSPKFKIKFSEDGVTTYNIR